MIYACAEHQTLPAYSLSIGLLIGPGGNTHTGFVFNDEDGNVMFCHLAWHYILKLENLTSSNAYPSLICNEIEYFKQLDTDDSVLRQSAIDLINHIYEKNARRIPYTTRYTQACFNHDGSFHLTPPNAGLTCSTFVIAACKAMRIDIVELTSWIQRKSDESWRENIIKEMASDHRTSYMVKIIQSEKHSIRYRPEEVFCASSIPEQNASFGFCRLAGRVSKYLLNRLSTPGDIQLYVDAAKERMCT